MPQYIRITFIKTPEDNNAIPDPLEVGGEAMWILTLLQKDYDQDIHILTFDNPSIGVSEAVRQFAHTHPGCIVEEGWRADGEPSQTSWENE